MSRCLAPSRRVSLRYNRLTASGTEGSTTPLHTLVGCLSDCRFSTRQTRGADLHKVLNAAGRGIVSRGLYAWSEHSRPASRIGAQTRPGYAGPAGRGDVTV